MYMAAGLCQMHRLVVLSGGEGLEEQLWSGLRMQYCSSHFRLSTDSMLLADFAQFPKSAALADLGCGCGSLSLLLAAKYPHADITAIELQREPACMAEENAKNNALQDRLHVICGDLRQYRTLLRHGAFDGVISNPPYYPVGSGAVAASEAMATARTELSCTLDDLCACAAWLLRCGGRFCLVHKPERLAELMYTLHTHKLEPKRIRFVRHRPDSPVSLVLLESRAGAKAGLVFEPDLILQDADGQDSAEMRRIYHHQEV